MIEVLPCVAFQLEPGQQGASQIFEPYRGVGRFANEISRSSRRDHNSGRHIRFRVRRVAGAGVRSASGDEVTASSVFAG